MAETERGIPERGGRLVLVHTASKPSYGRTRSFYEEIGYKELAPIPDYYVPSDDRIKYGKQLR